MTFFHDEKFEKGYFKSIFFLPLKILIFHFFSLTDFAFFLTIFFFLQIFVENERARLTKVLANMKEKEGDLKKASKLMQEIQIETFNTMPRREKVEFILEQIRLCIATNDWIRARIISRKISAKALADESLDDLKQRYYHLMVKYYTHKSQWIDVCKSYLEIYHCKSVIIDEKQWSEVINFFFWRILKTHKKIYIFSWFFFILIFFFTDFFFFFLFQALKSVIVYLLLSAYDNEQSDLSHRVNTYKNLEKLGKYKSLLNNFLTKELMQWPKVENQYKDLLNEHDIFSQMKGNLWSVFQK